MDSHDGQRDPDQALILDGIRALHDRLDKLERRAKTGMTVQAAVSIVTVALVAARAVNILR